MHIYEVCLLMDLSVAFLIYYYKKNFNQPQFVAFIKVGNLKRQFFANFTLILYLVFTI